MVSGPCQLPANDTVPVVGAVCGPLQPAAPTTPVQSVKTTMASVAWRSVMWFDSDGDYTPERRPSDRTTSASRAARRCVPATKRVRCWSHARTPRCVSTVQHVCTSGTDRGLSVASAMSRTCSSGFMEATHMVSKLASRSKIVLGVVTLLAVVSIATVHPAAAKDPAAAGLSVPVVGTATSGTITGALNGTATITKFVASQGQLTAVGTLVGTVTDTSGAVRSIATTFSTQLAPTAVTAACEILHLDLGAINLNLLGLQVQTNEIVLDIAAVPGAGNLLGNLL